MVRLERLRLGMATDNSILMQENMRLRAQLQEQKTDEEMNAIMNQAYKGI